MEMFHDMHEPYLHYFPLDTRWLLLSHNQLLGKEHRYINLQDGADQSSDYEALLVCGFCYCLAYDLIPILPVFFCNLAVIYRNHDSSP